MSSKEAVEFFEEHLHDLPNKFLECRDIRHSWKVYRKFQAVNSTGSAVKYLERTLRCTRCHTERQDVLSARTFDRVSTSYAYPQGYTIQGNKSGNRGQSIRREVYLRSSE
jgi:hypothetical protein